MRRTIDYPSFVRHLGELGVEVPTRDFLQDPAAFWAEIPEDARHALLEAFDLETDDLDQLELKVGRRPDAPKTEANLLVVVSGDDDVLRSRETPGDADADDEGADDADVGDRGAADAEDEADGEGPPEPPEEDEEDDARPIVEIKPPEAPNLEVVEVYEVNPPYAFVRILYDQDEHEYWYEILEPELSDREQNVLGFIEETLVDVIEVGLSELTETEAEELLREQVDQIIYDYSITLSPRSKRKLLYYILRDFLGFAKLDVIMEDDAIEDVSCDGPNIPVFLYHRKYESLKSTAQWETHEALDSYVIRLAQRSGKHISIAEPLLDATLPDGSRLNATLGDEVTSKGSTFTIRKFKEDPFTPPDLIRYGTMSVEMLAYWWIAVQNGGSAIYAGGTASGKTTSLNAILLFIPPQMKIVSIEDTREVNLPHLNWIPAFTRSGFGPRDAQGNQAGEIDMFTLLKAALRQRPEYILVGEVRGREAYALFQAMATGHTAYGTMHADSVSSVIHRLESEPISVPRSLLEALDIVSIQMQTRLADKRVRRTKNLVEIVGLDPHTREILTNDVFEWDPANDEFEFSGVSYVLERIQMERNMSDAEMREEMDRRKLILRWMIQQDLRDLTEVGRVIQSYYKDPETLMERVEADMGEAEPARTAAAVPSGSGPGGTGPSGSAPAGPGAGPSGDPGSGAATANPGRDVDGDGAGEDEVDEADGDGPGGDEVEDAVGDGASQGAGGSDGEGPPTDDMDLAEVLGITSAEADALRNAGYGSLQALQEVHPFELAEAEGVESDLAQRVSEALGRLEGDGGDAP